MMTRAIALSMLSAVLSIAGGLGATSHLTLTLGSTDGIYLSCSPGETMSTDAPPAPPAPAPSSDA